MAFAQNKAPGSVFSAPPGGVEVIDEIHALGGGVEPRVISTSTTKATSSTSSPYSSASKLNSDSSSSQSPPSRYPSEEHSPSLPPDSAVHGRLLAPPAPVNPDVSVFSSMNTSFDWKSLECFDFSSTFPAPSENAVPADLDGVFDAMGNSAPHASQTGPNILEELGLGGEWQPVMDHLGL